LIESVGWTIGYQLAQILVCALLFCGLLWAAVPSFPPSLQETVRIIDELGWESSFLFTGVTSLAALLILVPLCRLRLGRESRGTLGMRKFKVKEMVLLAAAVVPLAIVSDEVYRWGRQSLLVWADSIPLLKLFAELDTVQLVHRQMAQTPFSILFIALALGPAIGEELVFRGLIGRGLTQRFGAWIGIGITSLLFAAAHGSPAHAIATLPVGIFLHIVYRATGNLWSSILLHCLLNGLAIGMMKYSVDPSVPVSLPLLISSTGYLVIVAALLFSTPPLEAEQAFSHPPLEIERVVESAARPQQLRSPRPSASLISHNLAGCGIVCYTAVFVWTVISGV